MTSKIPIQPIGTYFKNDKNGYVVNPASWDKIPLHWYPVIELVKQSYLNHLNGKLHSIYLRGSLVRGLAIDRFSDLDSFAIIYESDKYWETAFWKNELNDFISSRYDFVKELELMLSSYHDDFFMENPRPSPFHDPKNTISLHIR